MKKVISLTVLIVIGSIHNLYAHGEHLLVPLTADVLVFLIGLIILFRPIVGWKYRIAIFLGNLFSIVFSWILIVWIWDDYYFLLLDNLFLWSIVYYVIVFVLFALVCILSEIYIKKKPIRVNHFL